MVVVSGVVVLNPRKGPTTMWWNFRQMGARSETTVVGDSGYRNIVVKCTKENSNVWW